MPVALLTEQPRDVAAAAAGDRQLEPCGVALRTADDGREPAPACEIRVSRSEHGAYAWCWTHQALVGAMFGTEPFISRRVDAWRELRRCEA